MLKQRVWRIGYRNINPKRLCLAVLLTFGGSAQAGIIDVSLLSNIATPANNQSTVASIDTYTGLQTTIYGPTTNYTTGLAFDSQNNVYATNLDQGTIVKITPGGSVSTFANTGNVGPGALAFGPDGTLYVANQFTNSIEAYTPSGVGTLFANSLLNGIGGLAVDAKGDVFATSSFNNTVVEFNPSGTGKVLINSGLNDPEGITFGFGGSIFVSNNANGGIGSIVEISSTGVQTIFATNLFEPRGITFDGAYLYAEDGNNIVRFDANGNKTILETEAFTPVALAVPNIVPEPSSWLLLSAGLGSVIAWRKAKQSRCDVSNKHAD